MSSYRDEREALRARVDSLQTDVDGKQRELDALRAAGPPAERLDEMERQVAEAQREIKRMRAAYGPPRSRWRGVVAGVVVGAGVATGVMLLVRTSSDPAPVSVASGSARRVSLGSSAAADVRPPPLPLPPTPAPSASARPSRTMQTAWNAKVKRAKGAPVALGAPCVVSATLVEDGAVHAWGVSVKCGEVSLYSAKDTFNGTSSIVSSVEEEKGPKGFARALAYEDKGDRSGRSQISIATWDHAARVWDEGVRAMEVELDVDAFDAPTEEHFDPRTGTRCARTSGGARVKSVEGMPGVLVGARCTVATEPADAECRVTVKCGTTLLYDRGFAPVIDGVIMDDAPTSSGGDPRLRIEGRSVLVSDEGWSVGIERDK